MKHIKVFAPGTVANLGCGFDVMGLTLDGVGDVLEVGVAENAEGFEIRNRSGMELPGNVEENVITPAVRALLEAYGRPVRIEVEILEKIAPGSGIGSSAASSAAAVYGVNELLGRPFSGKRLVEFAVIGDGRCWAARPMPTMYGPALLGGVVLVRGYRPFDVVRLPVPDNFFYAVAHPGIVVSTREAREALPEADSPVGCRCAVGQRRRTGRRVRAAARRGADRPFDARRRGGAVPQGIHPRVRRAEGAGAGRRRAGHEHRRIGTLGFRAGLQLRGCRADTPGR